MSAAANDALWQEFVRDRSAPARHALADAYAPLARMLAAKAYGRRVLDELEFDDYLQYARVGLLEALDRFDPHQGARFETYAAARITGAILDGIASWSELQEQLGARRRVLARRAGALNAEAREPDLFERLAGLAVGLAVGLLLEGSGMVEEGAAMPDNTYAGVELRQLRAQLVGALAALPERQRQVVDGHYLQHQSFEQVADALGLSRGRVSQLHRQALDRLRTLLRAAQVDLHC